MKKQINTLLEANIIQPSTSAYAAPVLLVKKSDGSYRLVADLRRLNSKTVPDNFPLPNLTEMIELLSGATYFSSLDLTSGFHQMLMEPDDAHLTGITTEFGLYEFKRMPFGLRNASSSFQRLMSIVLSGLSELQIAVYIDDVIIASKTFEEHLQRLDIVFQRLTSANLKVKPSKCSFLTREIKFLGHLIREGQVFPDPDNINSIKNALPPKNKKQVRAFLGLTGFYRKFIPQYSKIALPLTNLTKDIPFKWSNEEQSAFVSLKNYLISEPCLRLPDFSKPFSLCTDASKYALGAVLVQDHESGMQHPVSFASRKLSPAEVNYSVVEKEALAVVFGINHFKQYLFGTNFTVFCDQKSLSQIFKLKDPNGRLARWIITLQEYQYKVIHKPGKLNLLADYLSRLTVDEKAPKVTHNKCSPSNNHQVNSVNSTPTTFSLNSISTETLIQSQKADPYCQNIVSKIKQNFKFSKHSPKFFLENNLLLCHTNYCTRKSNSPKLVVPHSLISLILNQCHDNNSVAHAGFSRTLHKVKQSFFWSGLYSDVKNYVASCNSCIERRGFYKNPKAPLQKIPITSRPFQKCSIDAVGPFITSINGNKWLLVISDYFTRYAEAYPVPNIQGSTVTKVLIDFISRHGLMDVLYSDRGSNFISQAISEVYNKLGIKKFHTVSYNPQGNGLVERLNKTLIESLSHLVDKTQEDWCEHVPFALMAFRNSLHRTINETPAFLVYGRDPVMPADLIYAPKQRTYADTPSYAQQLVTQLQTSFQVVRENLEKAADSQVQTSLIKSKDKNIKVGDVVYLHIPKIQINTSKKLAKQNHGPFRVISKQSPVIFKIQHINNPSNTQTVHINRLIKTVNRTIFPEPSAEIFPNLTSTTPQQATSSNSYEEDLLKQYPPIIKNVSFNQLLDTPTPIASNFSLPPANLTPHYNLSPANSSPPQSPSSNNNINDIPVSPISFLNSPSPPSSPVTPNNPVTSRTFVRSPYLLRQRDANGFAIYPRSKY